MGTRRGSDVQDDSVTRPGRGRSDYSGKSVTRRAEEYRREGIEAGRYATKPSRPGGRPGGKSTARDSTGIGPQDPIDPKSPNLR
jgi:hypothetical protein